MSTETGRVGADTIPVPAGGSNSAIVDTTLDGLLSFVGFLIKQALDVKLAEMGGPVTSTPISDACPVANRFPWNHDGTFLRPVQGQSTPPLPGLWAWEQSAKVRQYTLNNDVVDRVIVLEYIFPQLNNPTGMNARAGLLGAVARTMARAASRGRHESYGYGSDPAGTALYKSLNLVSFDFTNGQEGFLEPIPNRLGRAGSGSADGSVQRAFPAYRATFSVTEVLENVQPTDTDRLADSTLAINIFDDDPAHALDAMDRVLVVPDDDP